MSDFPTTSRCQPCEGGTSALGSAGIARHKASLNARWSVIDNLSLRAELKFDNYWQATAFVNAVAWIAHREDHHPDIELGYNKVAVTYTTHSIGGLSENDFICAAQVDALLD